MSDESLHPTGEPKKPLIASEQMRKFLNMESGQSQQEPLHAGDIPPDLPFLETLETPPKNALEIMSAGANPKVGEGKHSNPITQILRPSTEKGHEAYAFVLWALKSIVPYVVIFAIGLGLYFFYFSDFSINNLFKSNNLTIENVSTTTNADLEKLKTSEKINYDAWIKQFFFEVNDAEIISMDTDVSGNGLTNFEKYLLNLNPKVYSTRGGNQPDGQLVINGTSPWTGKPFTDKQKELVDKYLNKEVISNRITAAALTRGATKFAEYVNPDSPYYITPSTEQTGVPQTPGSSGIYEPTNTNPEIVNNQTAGNVAQQTQNQSQGNLNSNTDINLSVPGRIEIPSNNISVPLIWTTAVANFEKDLKKGVVHYPGTALPGQTGTSYISGHSSGYLWDKSPYKTIFAGLGNVKDGTSFTVTVTLKNGKQVRYNYVVERRGEYAANDQAQFVNTADSVVALSTCWPIGTTAKRLVLFGKLTQTENL